MDDGLSRMHYTAVRTEIEGRFFTPAEAAELKLQIDLRIVTDPELRAAAANCWPTQDQETRR